MGSFSLSLSFFKKKKKTKERKRYNESMNLGERGTLNATDQNRFCLHDSNDDRWSIGLQFVDRNIRRDVSLVEERNDRISKRLKEKKKKKNEIGRNIGTTTTTTTATFRSVLERKRTEDPIVTLRYLEVRRFARCYKKRNLCT